MLDAVESFVTSYCPAERLGTYRDAFAVLEGFDVQEFETDAMNLIAVVDHYGAQSAIDIFHNKLEDYIDQILKIHDVTIDEDCRLSDRVLVANALKNIETYIDHDVIIRVTETDEDPLEKFLELAELTGGSTKEYLSTFVFDVSKNLIEQVELLHLTAINEEEEQEKTNPQLLEQLRLFRAFAAKEDSLGMKMVRNNYPIGAAIAFYLDYAKKHMEYLEDDVLAVELLMLLYMASDTYKDPIQGFRKFSALMFEDLVRITKLDRRIAENVQRFESFKLSQQAKNHERH